MKKIFKGIIEELSDTVQALLALVVICIIAVVIMIASRAIRYTFADQAGKQNIKNEIELVTGTYVPSTEDKIAALKAKRELAISKARKNRKNSQSIKDTIEDNLEM